MPRKHIWRMDRVFDATKPRICHERRFVSSGARGTQQRRKCTGACQMQQKNNMQQTCQSGRLTTHRAWQRRSNSMQGRGKGRQGQRNMRAWRDAARRQRTRGAAERRRTGARPSSGQQRDGSTRGHGQARGNTRGATRGQREGSSAHNPPSYTQKSELLTPRTFFTAAPASLHAKGRGQPASPCGALSGNPRSLVLARSRSSRRLLEPAPRTHAFRYSAA